VNESDLQLWYQKLYNQRYVSSAQYESKSNFPTKKNCSPQAIQPLKPFFLIEFQWGLRYGSFWSLLWMANEVLPINNVILKVKTKYHECNKCEHEFSNCMNTYRSPQK